MKNFLLIAIFLTGFYSSAQDKSYPLKQGDVIYLSVDENKKNLEILITSRKNESDKAIIVNGKDISSNLYFEWLNPLVYKINWTDKIEDDESYIKLKQFLTYINALPLLPQSNQTSGNESLIDPLTESYNLKNGKLILWEMQLANNPNLFRISEGDIKIINAISKKLVILDTIEQKDYSEKLLMIFKYIISIDDPKQVNNDTMKEYEAEILAFKKEIQSVKTNIENIKNLNELLSDSYDLKTSSIGLINDFFNELNIKAKTIENTINSLEELIKTLKQSVKSKASILKGKENSYKIRTVDFDIGKKLQTKITVTSYNFKNETFSFEKKDEIINETITFKKFDVFTLSFSTGVFYSNTNLNGYGITTDGSSKITETEIKKNTAIVAAFLNIDLRISQYFAPIIQIGADPTKKYPYLLLGTGFMIPAANLAITGGPIWTWQQSLKALKVGDTVESTTDLENDIEYKFTAKPKGWYLGFQYNF
jgi:hypothetical protein